MLYWIGPVAARFDDRRAQGHIPRLIGFLMRPEGAYARAKLHMAGEALLIVEFGESLTPAINEAAIGFDTYLQDNPLKGLLESAPTNRSVALRFDPLAVSPKDFRALVGELEKSIDWFSSSKVMTRKRWRMPVCYGGECGPDLAEIAERQGVTVAEVIEAHLSTIQRVFMIGFAPGFLYTGMLPELFQLPRSQNVKAEVPAGAVSVAIGQTVISSTPNPTGWYTIGRTPFLNFDPSRTPPFLISAGDEIEFYAIEQAEFAKLHTRAGQGFERVVMNGEGD